MRELNKSFMDDIIRELGKNPSNAVADLFLKYGTISSPEKGYRLEFVIKGNEDALLIQELLSRDFISFKSAIRDKKYILYLNANEDITNFLVFIGASQAAMKYMETYIEKDYNNRTNRQYNCEMANIDKSVRSNEEQLKYIEKLNLSSLPPKLRETARIRIENPEDSLSELAQKFTPPLTRSGIYHRLQKLKELANKN